MSLTETRERLIKSLENAIYSSHVTELPHQDVMELILSYFFPESQLRSSASKLLERFGTVACAMEADYSYLLDALDGNKDASIFFKVITMLGTYYRIDKIKGGKSFSDLNYITQYCSYRFAADKRESLLVILLDASMKMMGTEIIGDGDGTGVYADMEKLAQAIFRYGASSFILVHNHPSGDARPSDSDLELTEKASKAFEIFNKTLIEHIIITGDSYFPIIHMMRRGMLYKYMLS